MSENHWCNTLQDNCKKLENNDAAIKDYQDGAVALDSIIDDKNNTIKEKDAQIKHLNKFVDKLNERIVRANNYIEDHTEEHSGAIRNLLAGYIFVKGKWIKALLERE